MSKYAAPVSRTVFRTSDNASAGIFGLLNEWLGWVRTSYVAKIRNKFKSFANYGRPIKQAVRPIKQRHRQYRSGRSVDEKCPARSGRQIKRRERAIIQFGVSGA
jgi:Flp pilus assembly protein TadB